jgi:DNA invertase Pin-like site-specific DNA recombinase
MKWCIYARVSERGSGWHEKGIETSIPTQVEAGRRWIALHDPEGHVVRVIEDEFQGGGSLNRPGVQQVLAELDTDRWDSLWVVDWDRVSRSMEDSLHLLKRFQATGKGLVSSAQNWDYSTPFGRLALHVAVAFAEYFRAKLGTDTRRRMLSIAESGLWPAGNCPTGYRRAGKHDNRLVPDERTAERVRDLFARYAAGEPIGSLRRDLFPQFPQQTLYKILHNTAYIGRCTYGGIDVPAQWEPLVPADVFAAVQRSLPGRTSGPRPSIRKYAYLLLGLVRCSCGRPCSGTAGKGRHGGQWWYYRCQPCKLYVRADALDAAVVADLGALALDRHEVEAMAADLHQRHEAARKGATPELARVDKALAAARKEKTAIDKAVTGGLLTKANADEWNARAEAARAEIARLEARRGELAAVVGERFARYELAEEILRDWADAPKQLRELRHDPVRLAEYLRMRVQGVRRTHDGWTVEYWNREPGRVKVAAGGSRNSRQWRPGGDCGEPLRHVVSVPGVHRGAHAR